MRRVIDQKNEIVWTARFPSAPRISRKRRRALIGIGGNIGDVKRAFDRLFLRFISDGAIDVIKTSPLFINPDFAAHNTPIFTNAVILIQTNLSAFALLKRLQNIEKRFGRTRSFKNAPRTLDLDILFFETKRSYNPKLLLPHPKWRDRASVTIPMLLLQGTI
ncbi:MAG: 2-amino-4-hydroxy-6-hydroxymethyldihydropteridine diphosphokinase [Helicobacteraceae bacterium]|jgi:2-amino-4-hydroxy-6-hydroxymethyldihydropteridine diphosphokinase|nr:2-amino-4-hydroxy-6-hydroxymethyldihydropteridine diphosphokinase [Helicobacteraceae bacterium]